MGVELSSGMLCSFGVPQMADSV